MHSMEKLNAAVTVATYGKVQELVLINSFLDYLISHITAEVI
jgi:hypothetical protein